MYQQGKSEAWRAYFDDAVANGFTYQQASMIATQREAEELAYNRNYCPSAI